MGHVTTVGIPDFTEAMRVNPCSMSYHKRANKRAHIHVRCMFNIVVDHNSSSDAMVEE